MLIIPLPYFLIALVIDLVSFYIVYEFGQSFQVVEGFCLGFFWLMISFSWFCLAKIGLTHQLTSILWASCSQKVLLLLMNFNVHSHRCCPLNLSLKNCSLSAIFARSSCISNLLRLCFAQINWLLDQSCARYSSKEGWTKDKLTSDDIWN